MYMAAIIAGGRARRLNGQAKALLPWGEARIIDHQVAALRQVTGRLMVVANEPGPYLPLGIPVVHDVVADAGALGGLYTALTRAGTERVLAVACDLPFLTAAFLAHLAHRGGTTDVTIPRTEDGYQPLCAVYATGCLEPMRRQIEAGELQLQQLLAHATVREIGPRELAPFDPNGTLFFNVNTPADYQQALALRARLAD